MPDPLAKARQQMDLLERICTFGANLPLPPVSVPQDPVGASGLDVAIFLGLGVVGVWAAVDAYRARKKITPNVETALRNLGPPGTALLDAWIEIEDLRDLHAHNFAGEADATFFGVSRAHGLGRRSFHQAQPSVLLSGAAFDGERVLLRVDHLNWYISQGRAILAVL
jgi:hypothetical protein